MNARHARTVALIRQLRALRPAKRHRGKIPPQQQPDAIRLEYAKALERLVCERAREIFEPIGKGIVEDLARLRRLQEQQDSAAPAHPELRALAPIVTAALRAAGSDRAAPRIYARPDLGDRVGDVQGCFAVYDPAADEIHLGAVPLALLSRPLALGAVGSDDDVLAIKILTHEALHAAARGRGGGSIGIAPVGDSLVAVEEATAEIAAQLLVPQVIGDRFELLPAARARAEAPLFRWEQGDVRLARPTSYPTWVSRIARLATLARVPLLQWVLGIREQRAGDRLDSIARWLACDRGAVVEYLARPRGERDSLADAARSLGVTAPLDAPAWAATGDPAPGEISAQAVAVVLQGEAALLSPHATATDALAAIAQVDRLADARASLHARTALQQRVNIYSALAGASSSSSVTSGPRAALVLAFNEAGELLLGKRREGGRWAIVGGGVEANESPLRAAARELEEEAYLVAQGLTLINHFTNRAGTRIWVYRCTVRGAPTGYYDPDREFSALRFFDVTAGLPADVAANLAGPTDPADNILIHLLANRRADAAPRRRGGRAAPPPPTDPDRELRAQRARAGAAGRDLGRAQRQGERAARLIDRAAERFAESFRPRELEAVARRFGERTSDFQREQLDRQTRAAMGIGFESLERPIRDQVDEWAAQNVDLVRSIGDRYFDRLRLDVQDAYAGGTHPDTLAQEFTERYDMSLNDARRLARDQIGKLNADVNHERQRSLGIERATWRSMHDNRVCDECDANDGQSFDINAGINGVMPGYCHPTDRCYSEPDFSPLLPPDDEATQ